MRIACAVCTIVCLLVRSYIPSDVRAQEAPSVPFVEASDTYPLLASGYYVFRDEVEWAEKFVRELPVSVGPPPAPDFTDSLVIAVSYSWSGCTETGGEIDSMDMLADTVRIHLTHVYQFNIVCLAELPRQYFYRVAHADVAPEAVFAFHPAELPYDVEPEQWYPLAVGNAWHFQDYRDQQVFDRIEVIDEMIDVNGAEWYRLVEAFSSDNARPAPAPRYLRWTDDAFLLTSADPAAYADTVHAEFADSPFLIDGPPRWVDLIPGGSVMVGVVKNNMSEFHHAVTLWGDVPDWGGLWYARNVGPLNGLVAAIIGGEDFEDTSLIRTVLSAPPEAIAGAGFDLHVYPNPSADVPTVSFTASGGSVTIEVYDVLGRRVSETRSHTVPGERWIGGIDAPDLASGTYFVRVHNERGDVETRAFSIVR